MTATAAAADGFSTFSDVIVQGDNAEWMWDDVRLDTERNKVMVLATGEGLASNYMVIGVSEAFASPSNAKPE